jgi:Fur family ferric uptake transcriptional regulator
MTHHLLNYAARLREQGMRLTPQREMILDAICEGGGHTTFDEIYARLHARAPAINQATVYRALKMFCDLELVVAADLGDGKTVYEIASVTPHHHLVCRACGQVETIDQAALALLCAAFERERGFTLDMNHLVLFGYCCHCRSSRTSKEARR